MKRAQIIQSIRETPSWDMIVIGGGASGLGTALEAVSRGYRTLLVEAHDYTKGTSSRGTSSRACSSRSSSSTSFRHVRQRRRHQADSEGCQDQHRQGGTR